MSKNCKHDFIPVDVTWKAYWIESHQREKPHHVVLACSCGAVKLKKAVLVNK